MADPPRPPPLPPLPLRSVAPSEPFRDLTRVDRAADTERSGFPRGREEIPPPALDALTESTAALLRQELAVLREIVREALPTLPGVALPGGSSPPASVRTRSRALVATVIAGKYGAVGVLVAIVVLRAIVKHWPEAAPVIEPILDGLGL